MTPVIVQVGSVTHAGINGARMNYLSPPIPSLASKRSKEHRSRLNLVTFDRESYGVAAAEAKSRNATLQVAALQFV